VCNTAHMHDPETSSTGRPDPTELPSARAGIVAALAGFVLQQLVIALAWNVFPAGLCLAFGAVLGVCVPLAVWCRRARISLRAWVRLRRLEPRELVTVLGFSIALLAPTYAVNARWQQFVPPGDGVLDFYAALIPTSPMTLVLGALGVIALGPLAEEWVFRGLLQPALGRWLPAPAAILIVAVLFAAAHASLAFFPALLILGLGLGCVAWWTGSTHASWLLHAAANAVAYVDLWKTHTPETPELDRWSSQWPVLVGSVLVLGATGWILSRSQRSSSPGAAREFAPAPDPGQPCLSVESKTGNSKDGEA